MVDASDGSEIAPFVAADLDDMDDPPEVEAPTKESLLARIRHAEKEMGGHLIPDSAIEISLRQVIISADRLHLPEVRIAAERLLAGMPVGHFDCPIHTQCRLEETDQRIKTRHIRKAVEYGEAEWDEAHGVYTWTVELWPTWNKTGSRKGGQ